MMHNVGLSEAGLSHRFLQRHTAIKRFVSDQAAEAQSREYAAAKAAMATVIDVDDTTDAAADPTSDGPRPLRTLEQLVKELDELERPG